MSTADALKSPITRPQFVRSPNAPPVTDISSICSLIVALDNSTDIRYYQNVIKSFADKATAAVFQGVEVRNLPKTIQAVARRKLMLIDASMTIQALRVPPGNRLEMLKGDRKGQWSIRINDQWRICFNWKVAHAWDVEIMDYH